MALFRFNRQTPVEVPEPHAPYEVQKQKRHDIADNQQELECQIIELEERVRLLQRRRQAYLGGDYDEPNGPYDRRFEPPNGPLHS